MISFLPDVLIIIHIGLIFWFFTSFYFLKNRDRIKNADTKDGYGQ
jgi:hypothetical protein